MRRHLKHHFTIDFLIKKLYLRYEERKVFFSYSSLFSEVRGNQLPPTPSSYRKHQAVLYTGALFSYSNTLPF